jgi:hypothetical protein
MPKIPYLINESIYEMPKIPYLINESIYEILSRVNSYIFREAGNHVSFSEGKI